MENKKKFLISPSILSANFAFLGKEIDDVLNSGGDIIHFDVMDNHYVPNLTFGPIVLKSIRKYGITAPIDIHLMANPIDDLIIKFIKYGADYITFHPETSKNIDKTISLIKDHGCKVGLAFNLNTDLNYLDKKTIKKIDLITLMAVKPGFSGQKMIPDIYNKIIEVKKIIHKSYQNILLGIDGGVKINNIFKISSLGINLFIIGSAIFNSKNYKKVIENMRKELSKNN